MVKTDKLEYPGLKVRILHLFSFYGRGVLGWLIFLFLISCQKKEVNVFCIGDSTMSFYDSTQLSEKYGGSDYPLQGWCMALSAYLDGKAEVKNEAISGRSSKSFRKEGHWDKVKDQFKKGDYLIVQFGHNDETKKDPNRYTDPNGEFKDNLRNYATEAIDVGVHPVIATSIARRKFDESGNIVDTHGDYITAAQEVASELDIPLVDLHLLTSEYIQNVGSEKSKKLFLHIAPGTFKELPEGRADDTHLSKQGATEVARLFVEGLKNSSSTLKDYILK